jgi:hypothetical protein
MWEKQSLGFLREVGRSSWQGGVYILVVCLTDRWVSGILGGPMERICSHTQSAILSGVLHVIPMCKFAPIPVLSSQQVISREYPPLWGKLPP